VLSTRRRRRALLAQDSRAAWSWLEQALSASGVEIRAVATGEELQRLLEQEGPFDLVVTGANLPDRTGLGVLAHARALHIRTPFVVVVSARAPRLRIMVSDSTENVLSSRVVDPENLVSLATALMRREHSLPR
jgi:DNA-binding response OmpR family regulator